MLQEGTRERSSQRISDDFEHMGIRLASLTSREHTTLGTEALTRHWPEALELVADLARNAAFPEDELARVRGQRLTMVRRFRDDATTIADRVTAGLFYGRETPAGHPLSGTEAALESIGRDDFVRHYRAGFGPERATLIVVGDVAMDEARSIVEERLGGWTSEDAGASTHESGGEPPRRASTTIYLVDKPGAAQSVIRAGHLSVPRKHPDYFKLLLLNHAFGGQFTGRLNMNLRQDKGYSYGYRSWFEWRPASSLFLAGGSVQTAVTREGLEETLREFRDIGGARLLEEAEFEAAKASVLRQFPSSFETQSQVLDQLTRLVSFDLPDDYYGTLTASIEAVSLDDVRKAALERVEADRLAVLVVGDASLVEPGLRALGYPVVILDHEGREL
jgi:predicted Zn-dependent peptidase